MRMRKKSLNNLRTGLIAGLLLCGWGGMGLAVQAQSLQKVKVLKFSTLSYQLFE